MTIKHAVTAVQHDESIECGRLDEERPAGRITDRLLNALRTSSFCVADLTGCKPNVMWETGYAMALGKPLIIVTQDVATLPFDVHDMQALAYDRSHLAYYYDWREMGEYIFARFRWLSEKISGFTFPKHGGPASLHGAWWYDFNVDRMPDKPPATSGNPVTWRRTQNREPRWASTFVEEFRRGEHESSKFSR